MNSRTHQGMFTKGSLEMVAGLLAPILWSCLHYLIYGDPAKSVWQQISFTLWGTQENMTLSVFMTASASISLLTASIRSDTWQNRANERLKSVNQLERKLEERSEELSLHERDLNLKMKQFHETNASLQKSLDRREVMRLAAESLKDILGYDRVNVLLCTEAGDSLEFIASRGTGDDDVSGMILPLDQRAGVLFLAMQRKDDPLLVDDMRKMPAEYHLQPPWDNVSQLRSRSFILCPITVNGNPVGLFGVDNKQKKTTLNESDLDTVRIFSEQVSAALSKIGLLQAVELLTGEIQKTFNQSMQHKNHFSGLVSEVKSDVHNTSESVDQLRLSADSLYQTVDETGSATTEISTAVQQVSDNLSRLNELMFQAISATEEISAAAREVADHSSQSNTMAETVQRDATDGVSKVIRAHQWLKAIATAITETTGAFQALTEKTNNIEHFVTLIKEINQKTKLLSLNASIIAAQAGEHGRPFAVVAEEIQALFEETSQSALAIDSLVEEVRKLADAATGQLENTSTLVREGVAFGRTTEKTLKKISSSATQALELAVNISKSSHEQSINANHSAASIREMGEIAEMVSMASKEQASAINRIAQQVEGIETMAGSVIEATGQQHESVSHIDSMIDQVEILAQQIFTEIGHRQKESALVIEQLKQLKGDVNDISSPSPPASSLREAPNLRRIKSEPPAGPRHLQYKVSVS